MPAHLDLAARAAAQHPVTGRSIVWGGALVTASGTAHGLAVSHDPAGADPLSHPAFAALYARARAEQVVLALSARTNLVLAGTTAAVAGDGPLADELTATLTHIGTRVIRLADSPLTRLRATLAGLEAMTTASVPAPHYVIATGEHAPLRAATTAIRVDAAPAGGSFADADSADADSTNPASVRAANGDTVRPHVGRSPAGAYTVEIPPPLAPPGEPASGLQQRIADALMALSILVAAEVADPDARLAELVLS